MTAATIIPINRRRFDLSGQAFGRLTVIRRAYNDGHDLYWECRCSCDSTCFATTGHLRSGFVRSCGCLRAETRVRNGHARATHGHTANDSRSSTYLSWTALFQRCYNPQPRSFKTYGGANPPVKVCDRWNGPDGFQHFLQDMGERPAGTSLGRFGDVGNYSKENCAWQTRAEQAAEQKKKRAARKLAA